MTHPANPEVSIDGLYHGAINAANGGYICGLLASYVDGDAEVRINHSFPVETPLQPVTTDEGGIEMYLGDKLLGSAPPVSLELDIPTPPSYEHARRASENSIFLHNVGGQGCYVCSPIRKPGEGLRLFIGALDNIHERSEDENLTAALWRPTPDLAGRDGNVEDRYVWSILDCPGVYTIELRYPESNYLVLGSCTASIKRPLAIDEGYIVSTWQIAPNEGRKRHIGLAIHSSAGQLMACARQVCFDVGAAPS